MATILDGKALSAQCKETIRKEVEELAAKGCRPGMAVVLVGENPASKVYVQAIRRRIVRSAALQCHVSSPGGNHREGAAGAAGDPEPRCVHHGILVQLPLPKQINSQRVIEAIDPQKDVDAFHPTNVGYLTQGMPRFAPCTPAGIVKLMEAYKIDPAGKHCVVIGRSNIVGKPMALLLLQKNGTVTICHSGTKDLKAQTLQADILISAVGKTGFVTEDMVKDGAVVIDVAMNRNSEGKLCGDVDYAAVSQKASAITPVPGGVGPMTRVMLLENTLTACRQQNGL